MARVLLCWLGLTDIKASAADDPERLGPIAAAVSTFDLDEVALLNNYPAEQSAPYLSWLQAGTAASIVESRHTLSTPMDFRDIYRAAYATASDVLERHGSDTELLFHLSPGTSAMASIWIILSKAKFPAILIQSSIAAGVEVTDIPFEIAADFIPDLYRRSDAEIERLTAGLPPEAPAFSKIVHRSAGMQRVVALARRFAARNVRVLIEGESGTGKELMARAIHDGSLRRERPMQIVNCGAIPRDLVESTLFGTKKGAFTGAIDKPGLFEAAHGSTLFLDEIGELPLESQVKLLRVLQEGTVTRVGDTTERTVDVRIIAATNRVLAAEIREKRFREDLFYRLAEVVIRLPPLRERGRDVAFLIKELLSAINERFAREEPGFTPKQLAAGARKALQSHYWPGNIRELQSVLTRAAIATPGDKIHRDDIDHALLDLGTGSTDGILGRPLGLDIENVLSEVKRHYLQRAFEETDGNMTKAAELVGLRSYKVFGAWWEKVGGEH